MDKYNHWLPKLIKPKTAKTWAITLGQTAYYSESEEYVLKDLDWQKHENEHKRQWAEDGLLKFGLKYLWFNYKYGYEKNPYEIEAELAEKTEEAAA